ncbi:MAG TPA: DUF177 domain-containing protein [Pyrinomonadaceae bacterium]|nr:DUF177 domain-containing protein [Pyrinomonadaceae bacterium]
MRIEVETLTEEAQPFAHNYAEGELELGDEQVRLLAGTRVEGEARRKDERVEVSGKLTGNMEADCDLCLAPVTLPAEVEFEVSFLPKAVGEEAVAGEREIRGDEPDFSFYESGAVDIDELVREQLLLALPSRFRCGEECKGLCPHCGADLNRETCACEHKEIDPRWSALAALKEKGDK